jgi:Holliday junction resolvasome RuvABC endonuclease subunit
MSPTYLGVDPSISSTGIVLLRYPNEPVETVISVPKGKARLAYIFSNLVHLVRDKTITMAVMEGPSYNSVGRTSDLGEIYGLVKLVFQLHQIPYAVASPKELKKFGSGSGSASKDKMILAATADGCSSVQNDICDAWHAARLAQGIAEGHSPKKSRASDDVVFNMLRKVVPPCP